MSLDAYVTRLGRTSLPSHAQFSVDVGFGGVSLFALREVSRSFGRTPHCGARLAPQRGTPMKHSLRITTAALAALLATVAFAAVAVAASPHFISASASGPDAAGNLAVNFKIAGLGDNQTLTVTASANATAVYACQHTGCTFPS